MGRLIEYLTMQLIGEPLIYFMLHPEVLLVILSAVFLGIVLRGVYKEFGKKGWRKLW